MTKLSFDSADAVTRVDTRETEDGTEVRLFHKRTKLFAFGADDANEDQLANVADFIAAKPRTVDEVENFLTSEPGEEGDDEDAGGSIVPEKYRVKYGVTQRCGDKIAETLSAYVTLPRAGKKDIDGGLDRDRLREVADKNGLGKKLDEYEARELNGGLLRMNISNILRGMERRGEQVVIGGTLFPARDVPKKPRNRSKKAAAAK